MMMVMMLMRLTIKKTDDNSDNNNNDDGDNDGYPVFPVIWSVPLSGKCALVSRARVVDTLPVGC